MNETVFGVHGINPSFSGREERNSSSKTTGKVVLKRFWFSSSNEWKYFSFPCIFFQATTFNLSVSTSRWTNKIVEFTEKLYRQNFEHRSSNEFSRFGPLRKRNRFDSRRRHFGFAENSPFREQQVRWKIAFSLLGKKTFSFLRQNSTNQKSWRLERTRRSRSQRKPGSIFLASVEETRREEFSSSPRFLESKIWNNSLRFACSTCLSIGSRNVKIFNIWKS